MKLVLALIVLTTFLTAAAKAQLIDDSYSIEQIIGDDMLFQQYFECIMGQRVCTPGGEQLRDNIMEDISTGCADCSPEGKELVKLLFSYMIAFKGSQYEEFEDMYDPYQIFRNFYENEDDDSNY